MFKLFVLLSLCVACAFAAPGLLHATPILGHSLPAVHVVRPILTTHSVVRPLIHGGGGGYGHGHGYGLGHGHGHGWL